MKPNQIQVETKTIDLSRVDFICNDIKSIHEILKKFQDNNATSEKWMKDDANWKKEFDVWKTQIVEPLIKKEADSKVINSFMIKQLKYVGSLVAFLATLGATFAYVLNPIWHFIK